MITKLFSSILNTDKSASLPTKSKLQPGDLIQFGMYPQESEIDCSPIEWIVLATDNSTALCISKYCLITSGYCDPQKLYNKPELLWYENSLAREICNHHFFDTAFSDMEKAKIIPRKISGISLGAECVDSVFLLSEHEVQHYFPEISQRKSMPTPYAIQKGARLGWTDDTKEFTSWWLLPQENAYGCIFPKAIFQTGDVQFHGRNIYHTDFTIRPCIQIKTNK